MSSLSLSLSDAMFYVFMSYIVNRCHATHRSDIEFVLYPKLPLVIDRYPASPPPMIAAIHSFSPAAWRSGVEAKGLEVYCVCILFLLAHTSLSKVTVTISNN